MRSQRGRHVPLDLVGTARPILADLGWTTSEPPAGLPLLAAEREGQELQLTVHDDAARLEVRGTIVPIAPPDAPGAAGGGSGVSGYWSVDPGALITASYDWRDHADTDHGIPADDVVLIGSPGAGRGPGDLP
ncbi:MAG: hypothetical protein PGN15_13325 [Aeromicrobium erythreum]